MKINQVKNDPLNQGQYLPSPGLVIWQFQILFLGCELRSMRRNYQLNQGQYSSSPGNLDGKPRSKIDQTLKLTILLYCVIKPLSSIVLHTVSLNCRRSFKEQECARSEYSNICLVFSDETPQSHVVCPS